jgi:hypothetical protein
MLKACGMGRIPGAFSVKDPSQRYFLYDQQNKVNREAEAWIVRALDLSERTLHDHKVLLLKMADYLCDHSRMDKEMIVEMVKEYAKDFDLANLHEKDDFKYYRSCLKHAVAELEAQMQELDMPIGQ